MSSAEKELERVLTLLRNKIRERGFTQLEVQEALSWGRSYISQLLTKQKSLRVEQVLLILEVIGVDPGEFFGELYHYPLHSGARVRGPEYGEPARDRAAYEPSMVAESASTYDDPKFGKTFEGVRTLLRGLVDLLVDKNIINVDDLTLSVKAANESGDKKRPDATQGLEND